MMCVLVYAYTALYYRLGSFHTLSSTRAEYYILNGFDLAGGVPGIYKCTAFPATWELVQAVPSALGTHSHVVVRGGKLYIFVPHDGGSGGTDGGGKQEHELRLYVADNPGA